MQRQDATGVSSQGVALPQTIGKYRVLGLLGRGAMGVVYRARDDSLDRDVAVKVLATSEGDTEARARFEQEAKAVARLQHPNIITIYELGQHDGQPFMAMELLEGMDLQRAIQGGLRPDPKATLPIVLQVLAGLAHAHDHGIVHRDVKPSNVFLPRKRPAKITDFGVARLGAGMMTKTGLMVGTPSYMSPEQASARPVDGRSDLFSVGLILYELVTGERAFKDNSVITVVYRITHEDVDLSVLPRGPSWERLRGVLARALARDREARYPDAQSMSAELHLSLLDLGGSADWATRSDVGVMRQRSEAMGPTPTASETERLPGTPETSGDPRPGPAGAPARQVPSPKHGKATPPHTRPHEASWARWALLAAAGGSLLLGGGYAVSRLGRREPSPQPTLTPSPAVSATPAGLTTVTATPSSRPRAKDASSPRPSPLTSPPTSSPENGGHLSSASGSLERANALFDQGRYAAALDAARAVLRNEPGNAGARSLAEDAEAALIVETRLKSARDALRRGDKETALAEVRAGLAVASSDARLLALFRELTQ